MMFVEERHKRILDLLTKEKRVLAKDLAERFQVSLDTIRRDLRILEEKGLLSRTHGGAIVNKAILHPRPIDNRFNNNASREENYIAEIASNLINENDTVFMSGTSINFAMIKYLKKDIPYTVVTNSLIMANSLFRMDNINVLMIPGKVKKSGNITDGTAMKFVSILKFDTAFISGGGFSEEFGLSTSSKEVADFYNVVANSSSQVICLLHQEKIGRELFAKIIGTREIDLVITDKNISAEKLDVLTRSNVNLYDYK